MALELVLASNSFVPVGLRRGVKVDPFVGLGRRRRHSSPLAVVALLL